MLSMCKMTRGETHSYGSWQIKQYKIKVIPPQCFSKFLVEVRNTAGGEEELSIYDFFKYNPPMSLFNLLHLIVIFLFFLKSDTSTYLNILHILNTPAYIWRTFNMFASFIKAKSKFISHCTKRLYCFFN